MPVLMVPALDCTEEMAIMKASNIENVNKLLVIFGFLQPITGFYLFALFVCCPFEKVLGS